jgi:hypothetical protein
VVEEVIVDDVSVAAIPRMFLATALSKQPTTTPSVVFIGRAKQLVPESQFESANAPPASHSPTLPLMQEI